MNYPTDFINKVICGDCLEVMKDIPDNSVDLVLTDPPYNLNYSGRGKVIKHKKFVNDFLTDDDYISFVSAVVKECGRVLKDDNAIYIWIDWRNYNIWFNEMKKYFDIKNCIVWVKQSFGMGQYYRFQHEFCIFACRGGV